MGSEPFARMKRKSLVKRLLKSETTRHSNWKFGALRYYTNSATRKLSSRIFINLESFESPLHWERQSVP